MSMSILAAAEEDANPDAKLHLTTIENPSIKDSDEKVEVMSLEGNEEPSTFTDPAILAMKSLLRYNRDKLVQLRQVPLSQKRPDYLNAAYNNPNGIWDPELWHRSRSDTPSENGVRNEQPEPHKRRSGDPRERIRKEQDGIVLSPQRRSFNSGCFVPLKENQRPTNRPHSPLGKTENPHLSHRELPPGARRIGSGRILSREVPWDFQEKSEGDNDFGYRRERREVDRDDRFERRNFSREYDVNKDKEKHGGRNNTRYNDRRRIADRDEEPEWFSGGPVSQHETIELRGFDDADCDKGNKKKLSAAQKKRLKERSIKIETHQTDTKDKDNDNSKSSTDKQTLMQQESSNRQSPGLERERGGGDGQNINKIAGNDGANDQSSFNIDDILKCDTIAGLLSNGVSEEGEHSGSRFSRWFKRESPIKQQLDSRRSSLQDEQLIKNLLNDIAEPNVSIPVNSDLYFTPISPAANTNMNLGGHGGVSSGQKPFNLFEILQRGKQQQPDLNAKNMDASKVLSLEELEARMMHQGGGDPGTARLMAQNKQMSQKPEDDSIAFKRMLAHAVNKNGPGPNKNQPMSILEMLSHSQQQDEVARLAASQIMGPPSPNPLPPSHIPNDLAFKLQQVQNHVHQRQQSQIEMLSKLMNANLRQQMGSSPLPEMGINQSRELLSRPEAQAILQGLKRGDITPQHLYQQLAANAAMQPRHRELLLAILKLHGNGGAGVGPSPRVLSPVPPHPMYQQQQQQQPQQQLCVSPLPNAMHQRIPSPRELQVHTQNIMQRALIKKKLEEQQENFKKRQEMQQRGQSPGRGISPAKHTSSPTPLAFTPTSVLRKMTAEKDDDSQGKLPQGRPVMGIKPTLQQQHNQQWNVQQLKQPVGRPIVKANPNLQSSQNQQDQQQFYQQQQQQQQQQQRLYGQQQQQQQQHQSRKIGSQFPNQPGASSQQNSLPHFAHQQSLFSTNPQQFQQLTQHQLRAQHQQHQPPQQQKQQYNQQQNHPSLHWSHQQLLMGHNFDGRSMGERGGASNNGGDLSPTSNQLARWFSPELLERARAGKVPHMPSATAAQHAISLEEIERQTAPPVHN